MKYLPESEFDEIHFFGDKYFEGGNDHEIYEHPRTKGHAITEADPLQTLNFLAEIFPELPAPVRFLFRLPDTSTLDRRLSACFQRLTGRWCTHLLPTVPALVSFVS